jgi:hypothetical protein
MAEVKDKKKEHFTNQTTTQKITDQDREIPFGNV